MRLILTVTIVGILVLVGVGMQLGRLGTISKAHAERGSPEAQGQILHELYETDRPKALAGLRLLGGPEALAATQKLFESEESLRRKVRLMDLALAFRLPEGKEWVRKLAEDGPETKIGAIASKRLNPVTMHKTKIAPFAPEKVGPGSSYPH